MNIFYEEPKDYNGCNYRIEVDANGKRIWVSSSAWISSIKIDCRENLKLLPPQIYKYVDKWEQELLKKKEEKYYAPYEWDSCLPSIYFIYEDNVYRMEADAFETKSYHYFQGISDIIQNDLKEAGCIFTWYID